MGRPRGSRNKGDGNGDDVPFRRNTCDGKELLAFIRRIEYCNEQQKEISGDRQQVYKELKQAGYARDEVREIVKRRKMTLDQRQERAATLDMYLSALGDFADTPLGQAGADRVREERMREDISV
jgi:uncharacterized protein (UPF0335 family)